MRPFFYSRLGLSFDHLNNTSGFGIDPSDGRSGAKRPIEQPVASLPNFLRTLHRLSNPMPLTGRPAEHLRGSRHAILTSSAILWFLRQKERPLLVAWQRPLLRAAEGWLGLGSRESIMFRLPKTSLTPSNLELGDFNSRRNSARQTAKQKLSL